MRRRYFFANILLALGLAIALAVAGLAILAKDSSPQMLLSPDGAKRTADKMMAAFCDGDYAAASAFIYGSPSLGSEPENSNLAVELIWTAFRESMEYEISGECYVRESGVSVDVTLRALDPSAVILSMEGHAKELLGRRIAAAEDVSELYDADNNFRQEIIDKVLRDATMQSLADNKTYQEYIVTLNLIPEQGKWWVLPDEALQNALSGAF